MNGAGSTTSDVGEPARERRLALRALPNRRARRPAPRSRTTAGGDRGVVGEARRAERELAAAEASGARRPLDQLAAAKGVGADDEQGAAAGGERRERRDDRASVALDPLPLRRVAEAGKRERPGARLARELGIEAAPELGLADRRLAGAPAPRARRRR